jgi:hypothetical protein
MIADTLKLNIQLTIKSATAGKPRWNNRGLKTQSLTENNLNNVIPLSLELLLFISFITLN